MAEEEEAKIPVTCGGNELCPSRRLRSTRTDRNYLLGCDRMLGQVGFEELCLVDHISTIPDVGLQFLVEGEGEVELIQHLPMRLLLLF